MIKFKIKLGEEIMSKIYIQRDKYRDLEEKLSCEIDELYRNPKKHQFYSEYDHYLKYPNFGPRGGRLKGRKTICFWCGSKKKEHLE